MKKEDLPPLHFRHAMLFEYFRLRGTKGKAKMATDNINSVYGQDSISYSNCREWFQEFEKGDYDVKDKPRSGRPSKVNREELEAVRKRDPSQTQSEIAEQLGVSQ